MVCILLKLLKKKFVSVLQSIFRFQAINYTIFTIIQPYTLLRGWYGRAFLCLYTYSNTNHTSIFYIAVYGSPNPIRNCNKMMIFYDDVSHQKKLEHLFWDCPVTQARRIDDAHDCFQSFGSSSVFLSLILPMSEVFYLMFARPSICEMFELHIRKTHMSCFLRSLSLSLPSLHIFHVIASHPTNRFGHSKNTFFSSFNELFTTRLPNIWKFPSPFASLVTHGHLAYFHRNWASIFLYGSFTDIVVFD